MLDEITSIVPVDVREDVTEITQYCGEDVRPGNTIVSAEVVRPDNK